MLSWWLIRLCNRTTKNIVEAGSVTDGANGAIAFSKNETKNIEALNTSDIVIQLGPVISMLRAIFLVNLSPQIWMCL